MNSNERLLKTLNHEIPDRVPWSLLINNYFFDVQEDKYKKIDPANFLKQVGADGINWIEFNSVGNSVKINTYIDGTWFKTQEGGNWLIEFYDYLFIDYYKGSDGRIVEREYITPIGRLTTKCIFKANSNSVFISEYPLKRLEDYKIFTYMINDLKYELKSDFLQKESKRIGKDGLAVAMLHATPVYELIWCFMGLERFHYFFYDYENETLELINIMANKYFECYKLYSEASLAAVVIPEDAGTTLYSPKFFDDYMKPIIKEYCKMVKEGGKIPILHACGHLRALTRSIFETGVECVESMSPPPTGNISVSEFKKAMPGICVIGGIPANIFTSELSEFKDYVKELLLRNKAGGNFILSSGDSVPADAKIDNIRAIPELVEKYGKY